MKVNKVYGTMTSFVRREEDFLLTIETQFLYEKDQALERATDTIQLSFALDKTTMTPVNDYEQNCLLLLDEFDDTTILLEDNNDIRKSYYTGKLIDEIAFDIITKTKLTKHYEAFSELSGNNMN